MVDVVKLALERRAKLSQEIKRLDDFIKTAEALVRQAQEQHADTTSPLVKGPSTMPVEPPRVSHSDAGKRAERMLQSMDANGVPPQNRPQVIRDRVTATS